MENLDQICAEYGNKFAKDKEEPKVVEALINKALSVLQEQGLYAFGLFCRSRKDKEKSVAEIAEKIENLTKELLGNKLKLIGDGDLLEEIRKSGGLASRLDDLMFAIQVLERSLIYAKFHAKAMKESR
jgi:glycosyltransferase involved in cell wall biosynthesis